MIDPRYLSHSDDVKVLVEGKGFVALPTLEDLSLHTVSVERQPVGRGGNERKGCFKDARQFYYLMYSTFSAGIEV